MVCVDVNCFGLSNNPFPVLFLPVVMLVKLTSLPSFPLISRRFIPCKHLPTRAWNSCSSGSSKTCAADRCRKFMLTRLQIVLSEWLSDQKRVSVSFKAYLFCTVILSLQKSMSLAKPHQLYKKSSFLLKV